MSLLVGLTGQRAADWLMPKAGHNSEGAPPVRLSRSHGGGRKTGEGDEKPKEEA